MNHLTLLTGGCRSGKSREALRRAIEVSSHRIFLATCPRINQIDPEMDFRILQHQRERADLGFQTLEEELDLTRAFRSLENIQRHQSDQNEKPRHLSIVVDCISLWVNNVMYEAEKTNSPLNKSGSESKIAESVKSFIQSAREISGHLFFVTNEVGLGLVPENKMGRLYRDYLGRANQEIAKAADEVIFMVSGLPMKLK